MCLLLTPEFHPHLRLDKCMVSVPKVNPGDAVFWHTDVIHSVEQENNGSEDSAGKASFIFFFGSFRTGVDGIIQSDVYSESSSDASKPSIH